MRLPSKILVLLALVSSPSARAANGQAVAPVALLDQVTLRLTGDVATPEQRAALTDGTKTLAQLTDELKASPGFKRRYGEYWFQRLKLEGPVDYFSIETVAVPKTNFFDAAVTQAKEVVQRTINANRAPCASGPGKDQRAAYMMLRAPLNICTCADVVKIRPWFSPDTDVIACKGLDAAGACGPGLRDCASKIPTPFRLALDEGFSQEPVQMLAAIVAEDRPWTDALTSRQGVVNGAMAQAVRRWGTTLNTFFPGTYPARASDDAFARTFKDPAWIWVDRGPAHRGVVTTLAFNRATNGARAKANRLREAFICRSFGTIPPDKADQVGNADQPLTQREPCKFCHASLDPMAQGFNGWLPASSNNYFFNPKTAAKGVFAMKAFNDLQGLAELLAAEPDFGRCAALTAFEFVMMRAMSDEEEAQHLPELLQTYTDGQGRMWPVIRRVLALDLFKGAFTYGP